MLTDKLTLVAEIEFSRFREFADCVSFCFVHYYAVNCLTSTVRVNVGSDGASLEVRSAHLTFRQESFV